MVDKQNTIPEQELITMLANLQPVSITIMPREAGDGSILYRWTCQESYGTHPQLIGALRSALETAILVSLHTPAPGQAITEHPAWSLE
jgi:hypothetical protein